MKKEYKLPTPFFLPFLLLLLAVLEGCARITFVPHTPGVTASIDYPEEQGRLYGKVKIAGVAQAMSEFSSYVLEVQRQPGGQWHTIARGNMPVPAADVNLERDILGVWETGGFKSGEYKIRLTVYAGGGRHCVIKRRIFLENCTYVIAISVDPVKFNPYAGETTSIAYSLAAQSEVRIRFYNACKEEVDSCVPGVKPAGLNKFVWKGKGPGSSAVNDNTAYTFSIEARMTSDHSVQIYYPSDGLENVTPTRVTLSPSFKPQRNEKCEINYTIDKPSWVRVGMGSPEEMTCDLHWYGIGGYSPQLSGSHTEYWNGRTRLWDPSILFWQPRIRGIVWAHTLPENFILTEGKSPEIINLNANPVVIDPDKGMGTDLSYTLSRDMTVTLKIYDGTYPELRLIRTLFVEQPRSAGPHIEHWDGLGDQGEPAAPPTPYTFYIEGADKDNLNAIPQCGAIVIKGH
jgi:hypothetical protein